MKLNQAQTVLSARMKLLKRQLLEWKTLLSIQAKVRNFANETTAKKPPYDFNAQRRADMLVRGAARLYNLMVRQKDDLDGMKSRHQQEDSYLEQVIKTLKKIKMRHYQNR